MWWASFWIGFFAGVVFPIAVFIFVAWLKPYKYEGDDTVKDWGDPKK